MKENFRSKEPFITNIYNKFGFVDCIDASILFDPFSGISIILSKFFHYVGANITIFLLLRNIKHKKNCQNNYFIIDLQYISMRKIKICKHSYRLGCPRDICTPITTEASTIQDNAHA